MTQFKHESSFPFPFRLFACGVVWCLQVSRRCVGKRVPLGVFIMFIRLLPLGVFIMFIRLLRRVLVSGCPWVSSSCLSVYCAVRCFAIGTSSTSAGCAGQAAQCRVCGYSLGQKTKKGDVSTLF